MTAEEYLVEKVKAQEIEIAYDRMVIRMLAKTVHPHLSYKGWVVTDDDIPLVITEDGMTDELIKQVFRLAGVETETK